MSLSRSIITNVSLSSRNMSNGAFLISVDHFVSSSSAYICTIGICADLLDSSVINTAIQMTWLRLNDTGAMTGLRDLH